MSPSHLVGRSVKVLAWYDHPRLIAARHGHHRHRGGFVGTITAARVSAAGVLVSVRINGLQETLNLKLGDVELLS